MCVQDKFLKFKLNIKLKKIIIMKKIKYVFVIEMSSIKIN